MVTPIWAVALWGMLGGLGAFLAQKTVEGLVGTRRLPLMIGLLRCCFLGIVAAIVFSGCNLARHDVMAGVASESFVRALGASADASATSKLS
jgi:hypothetical protein